MMIINSMKVQKSCKSDIQQIIQYGNEKKVYYLSPFKYLGPIYIQHL